MKTYLKTHFIAIVSFLTLEGGLFAAPANYEPLAVLKVLRTSEAVFKDASRTKPIVLKSSEDGIKYFGKEALTKISKAVDFDKQIVLVFAWKGSGGDLFQYLIKESNPEQIVFSYKPGLTRDLRSHVKVYVLRSNVTWTVK